MFLLELFFRYSFRREFKFHVYQSSFEIDIKKKNLLDDMKTEESIDWYGLLIFFPCSYFFEGNISY